MTMYEYYKNMQTLCEKKAAKEKDCFMRRFLKNAALGFQKKALDLTLAEADKK